MKVRFALVAPIIYFLFLTNPANGQNPNIRHDSLYSQVLKEQRNVEIIFPKKYIPNATDKFDVLYVLDGEWNTSLVEKLYEFQEYARFIPTNMIIVNVPNLYQNGVNMRDRDFTPTQTNNGSIAGGANNFLSFLKNELIPFVNKKYPTQIENNTLYGTSLGGLFAIYSYLHEPTLFRSYLTVEPSLWWDNGYLNKIAPQKLDGITGKKNTLWIASRDGNDYRDMGIAAFDSLLKLKAPGNLSWKIETYPNETHFSAIWKGVYDGLRFSYAKFKINGK